MRFVKLAALSGLVLFLLCGGAFACQNVKLGPTQAAVAVLPKAAGDFRETGVPGAVLTDLCTAGTYGITAGAVKRYASPRGARLTVSLLQMRSPSSAYGYLTSYALLIDRPTPLRLYDVGTASSDDPKGVRFVRGSYFITVEFDRPNEKDKTRALELGRNLAEALGNDRDEIPVLVKHLPEWEKTYPSALYLFDVNSLYRYLNWKVPPIREVLKFDAGEEAVAARYGQSELLIVENTTPQLATEADARIQQKMNELRAAGQANDTFYRRIGNYSVFVFKAPDQATADGLFSQITYEKTVSWLGDSPYPLQQAQRNYTQTMGGVILAVIQGAGLSILICGLIGGIFGALVFLQRRKRQAMSTAFSDAGGMLRLNLDEMTPQLDHSRLLDKGNG